MKIIVTGIGAFLSGVFFMGINSMNDTLQEPDDPVQFVHQMDSMKEQLAESKKRWLQFLDVPAKMEHRFHSIEEDITLLVFFARTPKQTNKK